MAGAPGESAAPPESCPHPSNRAATSAHIGRISGEFHMPTRAGVNGPPLPTKPDSAHLGIKIKDHKIKDHAHGGPRWPDRPPSARRVCEAEGAGPRLSTSRPPTTG